MSTRFAINRLPLDTQTQGIGMTASTPSIEKAVPTLNAKAVLKVSATAWFVTAVIGQLAFVYSIASF